MQIQTLTNQLKDKSIVEQLQFLAEKFAGKIAFSTSFGQEDQVLTDIIFSNNLPITVFTLDTGRMFEETYKTWSKTLQKYEKPITAYFPEKQAVEKLVTEKGIYSFYESLENRKECCGIRKIEPLKRALQNVDLWITGLRAEQSAARSELQLLENDEGFELIKCNPLVNWTMDDVLQHIKTNNVPYNVLHDKGFVSIGCSPCTRAIQPGQDIRAGRWWWENNSKKECGLHEK